MLCTVAMRLVRRATLFVTAVTICRAFVASVGLAFIGTIVATPLRSAIAGLVSALHGYFSRKFFLKILNFGETDPYAEKCKSFAIRVIAE